MIHGIWRADQPYVTFYCDKIDHYVWCGQETKNLPEGIYLADVGKTREKYTFSNSKVTCEACLKAIEEYKNK